MTRFLLLLPLALCACQRGLDPQQLNASAQFFLDHRGLAVVNTGGQPLGRPCLRPLNIKQTLLGGLFSPNDVVGFVEKHRLARTTHQARSSGYEGVTLTPVEPYISNWMGQGDFKTFCFGQFTVVKVEPVEDAKPITAGDSLPYIIPGTEARMARITFKLDGVPGESFVDDLKARPTLLLRGSMTPENYGRDLTVVAALPLKPENFNVQPSPGGSK